MVVEDEYFIADEIAAALERLGAEVIGPVPDRDEAMDALLKGAQLDLAILDVNLRGKTVFPLADALQQRAIPFLFATGYDHLAIPAQYRNIPRWEKPFRTEALARALPELLTVPRDAES